MSESLITYQTIRFLFSKKGGGVAQRKPSKKKDPYGSYFNCEWRSPPKAGDFGAHVQANHLHQFVG